MRVSPGKDEPKKFLPSIFQLSDRLCLTLEELRGGVSRKDRCFRGSREGFFKGRFRNREVGGRRSEHRNILLVSLAVLLALRGSLSVAFPIAFSIG